MPDCAKPLNAWFWACLLLVFLAWASRAHGESYQARIAGIQTLADDTSLLIDASLDYRLSPIAREALLKGIPLTWHVDVQLRKPGLLWDTVVFRKILPVRLKFHALLNQYEVMTPQGQEEMFLTLNAAIHYLSSLHDWVRIDNALLSDDNLVLALKTRFNRENLPVPLRPFSYLDPQWSLSSDWLLWPLTN